MSNNIQIEASYNDIPYGQIQTITIVQSLSLPEDSYTITGTVIFDKFNNANLAVPLQDLDIIIKSNKYKIELHGVCLADEKDKSISILRAKRIYTFKAKIYSTKMHSTNK